MQATAEDCGPSQDIHDWALLAYQRRWIADKSNRKVGEKSRQIGLTWATALEAVETASLEKREGGMDVWFMAQTEDDAREFIDTCADWVRQILPAFDLLAGEIVRTHVDQDGEDLDSTLVEDDSAILAFRIDFASGFKIRALSSRPARMRGKKGLAILDEAAYHDDLEAWLDASAAFLTWGGRVAIISTHNGADNEFAKLVEDIRSGRKTGTVHRITITDAIADGLCKRVFRVTGREWSPEAEVEWLRELEAMYIDPDQELHVIPSRSGGRVIPMIKITPRCILGPEDCDVIEICGGEPRSAASITVNGTVVDRDAGWWDGEGALDPDTRARTLRQWLDRHVAPALAKIRARPEKIFVGGDFGRNANLTTTYFGGLSRTRQRRLRLVLEMDRVPWPDQDAALDYCWPRISGRLERGRTDAQGAGDNSAERIEVATKGKVRRQKISGGWHEKTFPLVVKRFDEGSLDLPRHHEPLVDDLAALRYVKGKIRAAKTTTKDARGQVRHADGAFALALMEQAIGEDGPDKQPHQSRKSKPRALMNWRQRR